MSTITRHAIVMPGKKGGAMHLGGICGNKFIDGKFLRDITNPSSLII